eukprot:6212100-Pleurochrysis_carterae.AAC.1
MLALARARLLFWGALNSIKGLLPCNGKLTECKLRLRVKCFHDLHSASSSQTTAAAGKFDVVHQDGAAADVVRLLFGRCTAASAILRCTSFWQSEMPCLSTKMSCQGCLQHAKRFEVGKTTP